MNIKFFAVIITIIIAFFIFPFRVLADEVDDPIVTSEPDIIVSVPEITEPQFIETVPEFNYVLDYSYNKLVSVLDSCSDSNDYDIIYPDDFSEVAGTVIGQVIYTDVDSFFRDYFITVILDQLGITPDNPLYDIFYDVVGSYYDDLTGLTAQSEDDASNVLIFSVLGFSLTLGVVKWYMF